MRVFDGCEWSKDSPLCDLFNRSVILIVAYLIASVCFAARPIIFDTDMGNDIDDALALAMLHALSDRGECELIGVTLTNAHPAAVPYIRMINRFYGRGDLPVGVATEALKGGDGDGYMRTALRSGPAESVGRAEPAPALLRRLLSNAREKVVIVQTGFSTNLAVLLDSRDGATLAKEKAAFLVLMAGNFAGGGRSTTSASTWPPPKPSSSAGQPL